MDAERSSFLNPGDFIAVEINTSSKDSCCTEISNPDGFTSWEAIFRTLCLTPCPKGYMMKQYLLYIGLSGRDLNQKEKTEIFKNYSFFLFLNANLKNANESSFENK